MLWILTTTIHDNDGEVNCGFVAEFDDQPDFEVVQMMVDNTPLDDENPAIVVSLTLGGTVIAIWERVLDVSQET